MANLYGLPNSFMIMEEPPWDKESWKIVVKKAIADHQEEEWRKEIPSLSTLSMINPGSIAFGMPHPAWETCA